MRDEPTVQELLEAVATFLREQVITKVDARTAFDARVAANVLDIARRELTLGARAQEDEVDRLRRLLGHGGELDELNRALCERIACGEFGLGNAELLDHLWRTALDKVAIDQPGYSTYRRARPDAVGPA